MKRKESLSEGSASKATKSNASTRIEANKSTFAYTPSADTMDRADAHSLERRGKLKSVRREQPLKLQYCVKLQHLKSDFKDWCVKEKAKLLRAIEHDEDVDKRRLDLPVYEVMQFRRYAAELKRTYLRGHGVIKTFGMGDCGQLGHGEDVQEARRPRTVRNVTGGSDVTLLACGGLHNAALHRDGRLYTWGCNDDGSLGLGDPKKVDTAYVPLRVTGLKQQLQQYADRNEDDNDAVKWVSTGDAHTVALSDEGKVYFFGAYKDKEGRQWRDVAPPDWPLSPTEIALEKGRPGSAPKAPKGKQDFPAPVYLMPDDRKVDMVVSGGSFNAAVMEDNSLLTWGLGECGELGRPAPEIRDKNTGDYDIDVIRKYYLTPSPPVWPKGAKQKVSRVACGVYHIMVMTQDMRVATAGLNNYGQLGLGDTKNRDQLTFVTALDNRGIRDVDGGAHHSLCVEQNGRMLAFGRGDSGQLGNTDSQPKAGHLESSPVPVLLPGDDCDGMDPSDPVEQISCGGNHNLVVTKSGDVYTWGYGDMSALGHGKERDEFRPRKLKVGKNGDGAGGGSTTVFQVCGGGQHSAILCEHSEDP